MPRGVKKENLPTKVCVVCNRPFNWRKKWERCWDEVTTCSKSCNRKRRERNNDTKRKMYASEIEDEDANSLNVLFSDGPDISSQIWHKSNKSKENGNFEQTSETAIMNDPELSFELLKLAMVENSSTSMSVDDGSCEDEAKEDDVDPVARRKAERKAAKKARKAARRAQREGRADPTVGQKQCDMCSKNVDLLVRCTYDESLQWKMVCGKCWNKASGGVVDGDTKHPYYRYGGLWKNRRRS